jgi:hypothetical protein
MQTNLQKSLFRVTIVLVTIILMLASCKDDLTLQPTVNSFTPATAPVGATVTISGTNFNITSGSNTVTFNGTVATVTSATTTQLTVIVPAGATAGKISVEANGAVATCATIFNNPKAPTIAAFAPFVPASGSVSTLVVINGTNFLSTLAGNTVRFNGTVAAVTNATSTQLKVVVPAGATTGKVSVQTSNGIATSETDFTVLQSPPTIISFAPAFGLVLAKVNITGTNFGASPINNIVTFNGTVATVTSATATLLTVTVPVGASTGKISVTVNGQTATSANDFEVLKDIPRSGLVAFYPFNGNANDEGGNNLNGTVNGATLTANRFGTASRAYNFNGTSDFITMGNPPLLQINNTITVSGWINIDAFQAPHLLINFLSKAAINVNRGYFISQQFTNNGIPSLSAGCYSSEALAFSSFVGSTISTNTWIFFTLIIDGKSWKFYQDGNLTQGANVTSTVNILNDGSLGDLIIGRFGVGGALGGFVLDGSMDDIAIYNRALSDAEVTQLYNQTVSKY